MDEFNLAGDFPAASFEDWEKAAVKALRGQGFGVLENQLYEGFATKPLYTRTADGETASLSGEPGVAPFIRGNNGALVATGEGRPWSIIQFLDHLDITEANRQLHEDIANGTSAAWVQLGGNLPYGGAFLGARTLKRLEQVFDGVPLDKLSVYISGGFDAVAGAALMAALWEKRNIAPERVKGCAGFDPLGTVAASGFIPAERNRTLADTLDAAAWLRERSYAVRPFLASGRAWHQAGGSAREELAYTLAAGVSYWRALTEAGWPLEDAANAIQFALSADTDIFLTIAKFRAMRALWARATEAAGLPAQSPPLIAEMSFRVITERDPHVNLLRGTAAAFGAAAGGAEAILLIPFNTQLGTPDAFSRRLARNTQLLLQEEAHLGRVADPAGGSWYVENLTHRLAAGAWTEFRRIEAAGGLLAALESGLAARTFTDVIMRRTANLERNREKITGVSAFPNLDEEPMFSRPQDLDIDLSTLDREGMVPVLPHGGKGERFAAMVAAAGDGATLKGLERACETLLERYDFLPDTPVRSSEPFEALRASSDKAYARVHARPPIFLANIGKLADFNAKARWAQNFFAAGGIEVFDEGGFDNIDTLVRAFQRSPAPIACICASPQTLAALSGVPGSLKKAGAVAVYLVAEREDLASLAEDDKHMLDRLLYEGCNMLKLLTELHHMMRVKELGEAEIEGLDDEDDGLNTLI
ncbi:MAG: methylmalonyl-CoA mutase family protein [Alphaproteobacteria bacterium]